MATAPAIRYAKMNGLGNEIVFVDLRGSAKRFTAAEAEAIAHNARTHFDQMMVLHDPVTAGTEAFHDTRRIELNVGPADKPIMHSPAVVNIGNPHAVFWVDDPAAIDLGRIGPMLEHHPLFPERANISIARIDARDAITLRTWERGAGLTRACGSAACAAAVSAARIGLTDRKVTVTLPGGPLLIEWRADDRILMTGPAELEYEGTLDADVPALAAG